MAASEKPTLTVDQFEELIFQKMKQVPGMEMLAYVRARRVMRAGKIEWITTFGLPNPGSAYDAFIGAAASVQHDFELPPPHS